MAARTRQVVGGVMSLAEKIEHMSVEEYLRTEEFAPVKREYVDGQVFVMTGANRKHNVIAGNLFAALYALLEGSDCRAFMEAFKARVQEANCFYYPDVMVAFDKADEESVYTTEAVFIAEVLSPSTAAIDRREKRINYMKIPTLREYMIIHQRYKRIELYRRLPEGSWDLSQYGPGDRIALESFPDTRFTISLDSIYRNTSTSDGGVQEEAEEYWVSAEEAAALDW